MARAARLAAPPHPPILPAMQTTAPALASPSRARLWLEFLGLFVGVPIAMAAFFGHYSLFTVLWGLVIVAAYLLARTPGFRWRSLREGAVLGEWKLILAFTAVTGASAATVAYLLVPHQMFGILLHRPELWLMIMILYPIASAAPQEFIYRPLFFHRYGELFPNRHWAVFVNGIAFGLGHLFYMNGVTIGLTVLVGWLFALAYLRGFSFPLVVLLHGIAGQIVFTVGLGVFFYHGSVGAAP